MSNYKAKLRSFNFGLFAELIVIIYLFFKFYRVIAWRMKTRSGEIDIIAKKADTIAFIEVKARKNKDTIEVLTYNQQKRISDAAAIFLHKNKRYKDCNCRFDLIIFYSSLSIKHIKDSWKT